MSMIILLILLGASTGGWGNDLVSFISPEPYFVSRKVPVTVGEMILRAGMEPEDGKAQIAQLLALRWLAEHPEKVGELAAVRGLLKDIAAGKRGQDAQGFAREYAARALASIDKKAPPAPRPIPADNLRTDALAWFPQGSGGDSFVGGIDLRAAGTMNVTGSNALRAVLELEAGREMFYQNAEKLGNVRLDRIAFSVQGNPKKPGQAILIRATGAFDQKRLLKLLGDGAKEQKQLKGPQGEPIALLRIPELFLMSVALVGDTDVVALVSERDDKARPLAEIENVLEVRAGKQESILKGPLADLLKQAPGQAIALAVGEVSKETREKARKEGPKSDPPIPQRFLVFATRAKTLRVSGRASYSDPDEARSFERSVKEMLAKGREALKNPPPGVHLPQETLDLLNKALEGIKVEADRSVVALELEISAELMQAVQKVMEEQLKK